MRILPTTSTIRKAGKVADDVIAAVAPGWAAKREAYRAQAEYEKLLAASFTARRMTTSERVGSILRRTPDGFFSESDLIHIRERSNFLYSTFPIYSGLLRRAADNIVGTGLEVNPRTDDSYLNRDLKAAFAAYTARGGGWEVTGEASIEQQQRTVLFSLAREGDLLGYRSDNGWQFFSAQQIGTPLGYMNDLDLNGGAMIMGVQKDSLGKPTRYWVAESSTQGYIDGSRAQGLRADLCQHMAVREFLNQTRGLPVFHNALDAMEDFGTFLQTTLLDAITSSSLTLEINSPHANALAALGVNKTSTSDIKRLNKIEVGGAQVVHTFTGEKLVHHANQRPGPQFDSYTRMNLRMLGIPVGLPLEIGLMDFSQTNFAAAKMAVTQAMLTFLWWQSVIEEYLIRPVYLDWLPRQKQFRRWYEKNPVMVSRYEIIPPKSAWLDPYKEAMAVNQQISEGWESRMHAVKEFMNRELRDVVREEAEAILIDREVAAEKGISVEDLQKYRGSHGGQLAPVSGNDQMQAMAEIIADTVMGKMGS